jgi:hypothetical protein
VDLLAEATVRATEVGLIGWSEGEFGIIGGRERRVDLVGSEDLRLVLLEQTLALTGESERRSSRVSSLLDRRRRWRGNLDVGNGNGPFSELDWRHHVPPPFSRLAIVDFDTTYNPPTHPLLNRAAGVVRFDLAARVSPNVVQERMFATGVQPEPRVRDAVDEGRVKDEEFSASNAGGYGGARENR